MQIRLDYQLSHTNIFLCYVISPKTSLKDDMCEPTKYLSRRASHLSLTLLYNKMLRA